MKRSPKGCGRMCQLVLMVALKLPPPVTDDARAMFLILQVSFLLNSACINLRVKFYPKLKLLKRLNMWWKPRYYVIAKSSSPGCGITPVLEYWDHVEIPIEKKIAGVHTVNLRVRCYLVHAWWVRVEMYTPANPCRHQWLLLN